MRVQQYGRIPIKLEDKDRDVPHGTSAVGALVRWVGCGVGLVGRLWLVGWWWLVGWGGVAPTPTCTCTHARRPPGWLPWLLLLPSPPPAPLPPTCSPAPLWLPCPLLFTVPKL